MNDILKTITAIIDIRAVTFAFFAAVIVLIAGYIASKSKKIRKSKPGQLMEYETDLTADVCNDLLSHKNIYDAFEYTLESSAGGQLFCLKKHVPTGQMLDTVYAISILPGAKTKITLSFVHEAFGMTEPVVPESIIDEFMKQKLSAKRALPAQ